MQNYPFLQRRTASQGTRRHMAARLGDALPGPPLPLPAILSQADLAQTVPEDPLRQCQRLPTFCT